MREEDTGNQQPAPHAGKRSADGGSGGMGAPGDSPSAACSAKTVVPSPIIATATTVVR